MASFFSLFRAPRVCRRAALVPVLLGVAGLLSSARLYAQQPLSASLSPASALRLSGEVDSNSPAVWDTADGEPRFYVMTSTAGAPRLWSGSRLNRMSEDAEVVFYPHPGYGVWMESVVVDEGGTWYGYYHHERPTELCDRPDLVLPRIGAARSHDQGRTWEDLGPVLEAPPGSHDCATRNRYFLGGVGDFSVVLDRDRHDLYFFFSQYSREPQAQGVAVARMLWADRDDPAGRLSVWVDGLWLPPAAVYAEDEHTAPGEAETDPQETEPEAVLVDWIHRAGTPLVPVTRPWHDRDPDNDAFWGPSVHWNTYLSKYVMLLNRTKDDAFGQEGIYIAFGERLDDPASWSAPRRLLRGGSWYPQVIGLEVASGSDKEAGQRARLFLGGTSNYLIEFR